MTISSGRNWPSSVGISSLTVGWMCTARRITRGRQIAVHRVEQRVHDLVALDAQQRRAEDAVALRIHQHLHEALRLAAFAGAAHARHRQHADQHRPARGARLGLGDADARQRRIGEQRVGRDALADAARAAVEQVGGDDLVVVVRGVGEGAARVHVAQRPDAGHARAQFVVDRDEAARIGGDAGQLETQVLGVGPAADRGEQVAALDVALDAAGAQASLAPARRPSSRRRGRRARRGGRPRLRVRGWPAPRARPPGLRARSAARATSSTVTLLPKRRNICANSSPM